MEEIEEKYLIIDKKTNEILQVNNYEIDEDEEVLCIPLNSILNLPDDLIETDLLSYKVIDNKLIQDKSLDDYKKEKIEEINSKRDLEVQHMKISLTLNNEEVFFYADETSQLRLTRAVAILDDNDTIQWIDANNTLRTLTKKQCKEGMKIAGIKQTEIFIYALKLKDQVKQATTIEEVEKITWNFSTK